MITLKNIFARQVPTWSLRLVWHQQTPRLMTMSSACVLHAALAVEVAMGGIGNTRWWYDILCRRYCGITVYTVYGSHNNKIKKFNDHANLEIIATTSGLYKRDCPIFNPRCMRREGYGSRCVRVSACVCVCVCVSVTTLAATYLVYVLKSRCH